MFLFRAIAIWMVLMAVEMVYGIVRTAVLAPLLSDEFRTRQISAFPECFLIMGTVWLFIRWLGERGAGRLLLVGIFWVVLTVIFEFAVGRLVLGFGWSRLFEDYNVVRGGLKPLVLLVLALSPLIAMKLGGGARYIRPGAFNHSTPA